ncbi:Putative von Willebrand factor, type A, VIT domain, von Willebrand factor A-like domain superfamily [Septoria linicola]|uniref:von Willebrand factor, type A, VIT domain, von Willebrand factor A-like domain superfamily n=1 Tax=Septoria linicola TaxID=215465 RepID=A0A9Q9EKX1_9PEZI|nr:Putative von Willebrand factor, type A, VIT domain, von Willebrand factor A-like domain superfamily [Septoria linicola]
MDQLDNHICGAYYMVDYRRIYLPQVKLVSHTTIYPVSFTTTLRQTFKTAEAVPQVRYAFPLYDGVTVSGYTISFDEKVLTGVVQQKDDAKKTYQQAVDRGETAGLLESLPAGVFGVTLGNVPAQTELLVNVIYCGELKHDAAIDGLRYTLPTSIAPRYGSYPGSLLTSHITATSMLITVDVDMGNKSAIRKIQSPSHPIAVTMGEISKQEAGTTTFTPSKASATLSQGSAELSDDFILQVVIDDLNRPQAILEVHPTIPHHRAIMATIVPKFILESANPEVVFIADQSGSMSGVKNAALVTALKVFLKSLPVGVRFNVCAFGNAFQFLWDTSQAYNEENVQRAIAHVEGFRANFGGTELLKPIQAAFKRHLGDMPLEILVLTDGQIWQEEDVFQHVNNEIENGVDARVFTLGIGTDVSHTLVEGLARAGNGFAQFVTQNEDTDQKVMRMLKGALYAHTKDYKLEITYSSNAQGDRTDSDDEFEIVEKLQDRLTVSTATEHMAEPAKPRSFFDTSADLAQPVRPAERYAHLPSVDLPKLIQAPSNIPPLFPFNRSTIYILLDEHTPQQEVKSVTLRAKSASGPLELEVPISGVTKASSIHQLAARKAIQDLEEGRGWLNHAKLKADDLSETTVKVKHASRLDEMVEREAVRLGEKFQVASKWTSFVAVQDGQTCKENEVPWPETVGHFSYAAHAPGKKKMSRTRGFARARASLPPPPPPPAAAAPASAAPASAAPASAAPASAASSGLAMQSTMASTHIGSPGTLMSSAGGNDGNSPHMRRGFAAKIGQAPRRMLASQASRFVAPAAEVDMEEDDSESADEDMGFGLFDDPAPKRSISSSSTPAFLFRKAASPVQTQGLHEIIGLQAFTGAWKYSTRLVELIEQTDEVLDKFSHERDTTMTALVVAYFELKLEDKKDVWEMVVGKARAWLATSVGGTEKANELIEQAKAQTVVKK